MSYLYSEDQLIQRSTAEFLEKELGWKSVYAFDQETLAKLGQEFSKEVHLLTAKKRLRMWRSIGDSPKLKCDEYE